MILKNINCVQFKNHLNRSLEFSPHINLIIGNNGLGKTNILDAIHYLSTTKSALNNKDADSITHGKEYFSIDGVFHKDDNQYHIPCSYSENKKMVIKNNGYLYKSKKEHIGKFPNVFICPDDKDSIKWGSNIRRKVFDIMICQINKEYLNNLIEYNKFIKHRNSLLRKYAETGNIDKTLVNFYDKNIIELSKIIFEYRFSFLQDFKLYFINRYNILCDSDNEIPSIQYLSQLKDQEFERKYKSNFEKDLILKYTSMGIHKDDYNFLLNDYNIKNEASQGQKKSFFIALRLAQRDIMFDKLNIKPIILMDDIFEKLDDLRISNVINIIADSSIGQVFISHTSDNDDFINSFKNIETLNVIKI
ncbi:MAG: DNA replication/repair protein RecF [Bacteroidetes bacterium]|nr:DNA replication/repair protein RecF [Bacteroidota bacterium]